MTVTDLGASPELVILQSDRAPGPTVRFIDQIVRRAPKTVGFRFFSWRVALFSNYDLFHVHWPEFLVRADRWPARVAKTTFTIALLTRLTIRRIPVVRTVHNTSPHTDGSRAEALLLRWLDLLVTDYVVLNEATPVPSRARKHLIAHGHYEDVFAGTPVAAPITGDLLTIGRIEPYKGVDTLIRAFADMVGDFRLHVVGRGEPALVARLEELADGDDRIHTNFTFVTDAELVHRVTSAEVVVLPYRELHNSGVALVALSLKRPIITSRSDATELLKEEVGSAWVHLYDGELTSVSLRASLKALLQSAPERMSGPDLSDRDWSAVGNKYARVFAAAVGPAEHEAGDHARAVFVNPSGQRDNLGDSVLRRPYLQALRTVGPLHVYVGNHRDYISGLGLEPADVAYVRKAEWLLACLRTALKRRGHYALNAGEIVLNARYLLTALWQIPLLALTRAGGGRGIAWGIAKRARPNSARIALNASLALCTDVTWRDADSATTAKSRVMPDWAFSLQSTVEREPKQAKFVALSFRGDRPELPTPAVEAIASFASARGLALIVVTQVRRDRAYARSLADVLRAEFVDWPDSVSHLDHEAVIRSVYSDSDCVISDRIHALIIGATEGAAPLGLSSTSDEKLRRTLAPVSARKLSTATLGMTKEDLFEFLSTARSHGEEFLESVLRTPAEIAHLTVEQIPGQRPQKAPLLRTAR